MLKKLGNKNKNVRRSSTLIGQYPSCLSNWTVRAITRTLKWPLEGEN